MLKALVDLKTGKVQCQCKHRPTVAVIHEGGLAVKCSSPDCEQEVLLAGPEVALAILVGTLGLDRNQFDAIGEQLYGPQLQPDQSWIDIYIQREAKYHEAFGSDWNRDLFVAKLEQHGRALVGYWEQKLGLHVGALPIGDFTIENHEAGKFQGWKVRPEDWFYKMAEQGKWFLRNQTGELEKCQEPWRLDGSIVLFDPRGKPKYNDGKQMWKNDRRFLGPFLNKLRQDEQIEVYKPASSRFGVSAQEWDDHVKPAMAELISLDLRLERIIEFNILSQLYPKLPRFNDGQTNTSVWFEEFCEGASHRARGGHSVFGGLANVRASLVELGWSHRSFRPLGIL